MTRLGHASPSYWEEEEDIEEIYGDNASQDDQEDDEQYKPAEDTSQDEEDDEEYKPAEIKAFQRIWSEDQERAILKGVIRFSAEKGIDYASNMVHVFAYMKKSIKGNYTEHQLKAKLQKKKRKFKDNLNKDKSTFSLHEKKKFRFSKRIWGAGSIVCALVETFSSPITPYSTIMEEAMDLVGDVERVELDKKWIALDISQLEINMKKARLVQENIQTTFDFSSFTWG
ncbi:probable transcription factor At4g00610 [Pistacia vera]|uniref:probable transcription factor At4g00610 n=1 Tax=Pistacia vera TaxID=55513 RepID=UPI001263B270|nr:probable transcription factor At4g00610 [Pistacia vera]